MVFQLLAHVVVCQERLSLFRNDLKDIDFTHFDALMEINRLFEELDIDQELIASCVQFLEKLKAEMESTFNGVNQTYKQVGHLLNDPFLVEIRGEWRKQLMCSNWLTPRV